jgi:hypothetical protein
MMMEIASFAAGAITMFMALALIGGWQKRQARPSARVSSRLEVRGDLTVIPRRDTPR